MLGAAALHIVMLSAQENLFNVFFSLSLNAAVMHAGYHTRGRHQDEPQV